MMRTSYERTIMNNIEYINSLSPERKEALYKEAKRAFVKHILTFAALKVALAIGIHYAVKKARELDAR